MGFLSGVLEAVKNENEVTTYDTDTGNNINKVLDTLNNKIGSGREGLVDAVGAVKGWLEGYEEKVKEKTNNVTIKLSSLIRKLHGDISSDAGQYFHALTNLQVEKLTDQLEEWKKILPRIFNAINNIKSDHVHSLDITLRDKLILKIEPITYAIKMLRDSASVEAFVTQIKQVESQLVQRQNDVKRVINTQSETVQRVIEMRINEVYDAILCLAEEKDVQIEAVKQAIQSAKDHIGGLLGEEGATFDKSYTTIVDGQFDHIRKQVEKVYKILENKTQKVDNLVSLAERYFRQIKRSVLRKYHSTETEQKSVQYNWEKLAQSIHGLLHKIKNGKDTDKHSGLSGIQHTVNLWAAEFSASTFKNKVLDGWVADIVYQNSGLVQAKIAKSAATGDLVALKATLKSQITEKIYNELSKDIIQLGVTPEDKINVNVQKVKQSCETFARKLEEAINKNRNKDSLPTTLAKEIVEEIDALASVSITSKYYLEEAVKIVLYQLAGVARQTGAAVNAFTSNDETAYNLGKNVEETLSKVEEINQQFSKAGASFGEKIQAALGNLAAPMKELDTILEYPGKENSIFNRLKEIQTSLANVKQIQNDNLGGDIHDAKNVSRAKMEDLKGRMEQVRKNIGDIFPVVKSCNDALSKAINTLRSAVNMAHKALNEAIFHLHQALIDITDKAFKSLTNELRLLFADSRKADILALQKLVERQLTEIQEIIEGDTTSGIKGLLKTMNNNKTTFDSSYNVNNIAPVAGNINLFGTKLTDYVNTQIKGSADGPLTGLKKALNKMLNNVVYAEYPHFDYAFVILREKLEDKITTLSHLSSALDPQALPDAGRPVLKALQKGMLGFVEELGKGYVNRYDGGQSIKEWVKKEGGKGELTPEGKNGAKVFLTLLEILGHDLTMLREKCKVNWKNEKVCIQNAKNNFQDLGKFLEYCGYKVPTKEDKQDGELKCKSEWTGEKLHNDLLVKEHNKTLKNPAFTLVHESDEEHDEASAETHGVVRKLIDQLKRYYQVCHYATVSSKKYPTSVYDILQWLAGIPNNPVHLMLTTDGFEGLFEKRKADTKETEDDGITLDLGTKPLETYREIITSEKVFDAFTAVCTQSHSVLTAILGHGHSGGRYAVDFNTNEDKFAYPSDMNSLICIMFDMLKRLHQQLYFIYRQCIYGADLSGWSDCWYGQDIGGSNWKCNALQCPNQSVDQRSNQKHNQTCDQKCNQTVNCGLKSPLQSFLEDGLQGFLPHQLKFERGAFECSLKNHSSVSCKTPMGFTDISQMASHRQQGKHLKNVLSDFCSNEWSALSRLCTLLNCLLPSAPKSLEDMFGFYNTFLNGWNKTVSNAFEQAVKDANFKRSDATLEIKPLFSDSDHGTTDNVPHVKGDLYSLVNCQYNGSSVAGHPCGPYLRPMCYYSCGMFAAKHNDKYLSWIVYLTETFYQLLKQLYDECHGDCGTDKPKCRITKCVEQCTATKSPMSPTSAHKASCNSIVHCKMMRPKLFKYGFVYRDCKTLANDASKRTCKDFCLALHSAINDDKNVQAALAKLIYVTIPDYLLAIRFPFMTLTLALWLLSLLYLIHIMVIRLDLLHIKSHLHSPSSHRIAAQSLLAAARVNKLNRVFYLQP